MKIHQNPYSKAATEQSSAQAKKAGRAERAAKAKSNQSDASAAAQVASGVKTEVSSRAKEMVQARGIAQSTPDIREDRVAELKARIENGEYRVNSDAVADRLIQEHMDQL